MAEWSNAEAEQKIPLPRDTLSSQKSLRKKMKSGTTPEGGESGGRHNALHPNCEDQRRRTRRGPVASRVTYVACNMHSRHLQTPPRSGVDVSEPTLSRGASVWGYDQTGGQTQVRTRDVTCMIGDTPEDQNPICEYMRRPQAYCFTHDFCRI
jgi:hypothetical protein